MPSHPPGATDEAASITVTLGVTDRIHAHATRHSLVLGTIDTGEPPYFRRPDMGSVPWVANPMDVRKVATMIALDRIGSDPERDG